MARKKIDNPEVLAKLIEVRKGIDPVNWREAARTVAYWLNEAGVISSQLLEPERIIDTFEANVKGLTDDKAKQDAMCARWLGNVTAGVTVLCFKGAKMKYDDPTSDNRNILLFAE